VTTVALMGDVHGNRSWVRSRLQSIGERGDVRTVIQLGDWGLLWPGASSRRMTDEASTLCQRYDLDLLIIEGNHDNADALSQRWQDPRNRSADDRALPLHLADRVAVMPRGYRFAIAGRTFVCLGGATSLDRGHRTEGKDWWPAEAITDEQVALATEGGYADVLLSHETVDVPYAVPAVEEILANDPWGWPADALAASAGSRRQVTAAVEAVGPRAVFHGHMHCSGTRTVRLPGRDFDTTIHSLHRDGHASNLLLLDVEPLTPVTRGRAR